MFVLLHVSTALNRNYVHSRLIPSIFQCRTQSMSLSVCYIIKWKVQPVRHYCLCLLFVFHFFLQKLAYNLKLDILYWLLRLIMYLKQLWCTNPTFFCCDLSHPEDICLEFSFCFFTVSPDKTRVEEQVRSCDEGCGKPSGSRLWGPGGGCGWAGHPGAVDHSQEETRKWESGILPSTL